MGFTSAWRHHAGSNFARATPCPGELRRNAGCGWGPPYTTCENRRLFVGRIVRRNVRPCLGEVRVDMVCGARSSPPDAVTMPRRTSSAGLSRVDRRQRHPARPVVRGGAHGRTPRAAARQADRAYAAERHSAGRPTAGGRGAQIMEDQRRSSAVSEHPRAGASGSRPRRVSRPSSCTTPSSSVSTCSVESRLQRSRKRS